MNSSRKTAWSMPATGPRAPARTLVAVRAMVPVAQMPPNSAEPILATPCATSSQLERCRRPVMPSATTADSSDSMAPSSAMASAVGQGRRHFVQANSRAGRAPAACGMPPKRDADGCDVEMQQRRRPPRRRPRQSGRLASAAAAAQPPRMMAMASSARPRLSRRLIVATRPRGLQLGQQFAGSPASVRPSRSDLAGEDDDGDAGGEADGHRIGNVLDVGAEPQKADRRSAIAPAISVASTRPS